MTARSLALSALALTACATRFGCETPIDQLADTVEEYGFATISVPILSRVDERFEFDLDRSAKAYFDEAKSEIQGAAGSFQQTVQSLAAGLSVQFDPVQAAAFGEQLLRYHAERQAADEAAQRRKEIAAEKRAVAEARFERASTRHATEIAHANREANADTGRQLRAEADQAFDQEHERWQQALSDFASAVAPDPQPNFPTLNDNNTPAAAEGVAKQPTDARKILASDRFTPFGGLIEGAAPKMSNRSSIITAAGDKAVEAIFRVLGRPDEAQKFEGHAVLFGISVLSVQPGWRTKSGFAADISVAVELGLQGARPGTRRAYLEDPRIPLEVRLALLSTQERNSAAWRERTAGISPITIDTIPNAYGGKSLFDWLPIANGITLDNKKSKGRVVRDMPTVVAVSPMTDVQSLDLTSSQRERNEVAISIALALRQAGLGAQAEVFEQYVEDKQLDVRTRSAESAVSSYSIGGTYGFQVGPKLTAIGDVSSNDPEPDYRLSRQTFPVLLIIGLETSTAFPQIVPIDDASGGQRLILAEPYLRFKPTQRWLPLSRCHSHYGLSDTKLLQLENIANHAPPHEAFGDGPWPSKRSQDIYVQRLEQLRRKLFGTETRIPVPIESMFPPSDPRITKVHPNRIVLKRTQVGVHTKRVRLVLVGKNLHRIHLNDITLASGDAFIENRSTVEDAIELEVEVRSSNAPLLIRIPHGNSKAAIFAPVINVATESVRPSILRMHPSSLQWTVADGKPTAKEFEIVLEGEHLKHIDPNSIEVFSGRKLASITGTPDFAGGALRVTLDAKTSGTVVLRAKSMNGLQSHLSPPITLRRSKSKTASGTQPTSFVYETETDGPRTTRTVTIPSNVAPSTAGAASEVLRADLEKDKPTPSEKPQRRPTGSKQQP